MAFATRIQHVLMPFHGREAPPASVIVNLSKTAIQAALIWAVIFLLLPAVALKLEAVLGIDKVRFQSSLSRLCGGILFLSGAALTVTTACVLAIFGEGTPLPATCPRNLVVIGAFRYVRNPMALGTVTQGIGLGLYLGSPLVITGSLGAAMVWQWLLRPWEERDLERRFGAPYRHYRGTVRCWAPSLRAYIAPPAESEPGSVTSPADWS